MSIKKNRLVRIANLDILPLKPVVGWDDLQLDEALHRPELFHGNIELYNKVRKEAIKRGLGNEEDYEESPFQEVDDGNLPFLLEEERPKERHEKKTRKEKLKRLLKQIINPEKREASLERLLRLATLLENTDNALSFDRQFDLYIQRSLERFAHFVPSKETNAPPMWRRNLDYSPEEGSPYFGSVREFLKKFPKGISDWRKWRKRTQKRRDRKLRIASFMVDVPVYSEFENILKEAWELLDVKAHFVPEGGDNVEKLGDKEPKIWSDNPKWKSIDEFLKAHREYSGNDADDAALKAARDFVRYWRLTTKKGKK